MNATVAKLLQLTNVLLTLIILVPAVGEPTEYVTSENVQFETRCGWFSNPTPSNIWLYDGDGEWTIGVQGGHQVEGDWDWPVFKSKQWVQQNGHYGYGCACLQLQVDRRTYTVQAIKSSRARPLASCRHDRSLRKWKGMFR